MNDFVEYIVERRRTAVDILKAIVTAVICFTIIGFIVMTPMPSMFAAILVVGIIYVAYKIVSTINIEYEYIITNNEMDIDKIINKKSRKSMVSVNLRRVEEFEKCDGNRENRYLNDGNRRVIVACQDRGEGCYYMTFAADEGKGVLLFTPNEKIEEYIRQVLKGRF